MPVEARLGSSSDQEEKFCRSVMSPPKEAIRGCARPVPGAALGTRQSTSAKFQRLSADAGGELVCDIGLVACALHVAETGSAFPSTPRSKTIASFRLGFTPAGILFNPSASRIRQATL